MTDEVNRIIEEAHNIALTLSSDHMTKSIIKFTFTDSNYAPKSIDSSFVRDNIEYILKRLEDCDYD